MTALGPLGASILPYVSSGVKLLRPSSAATPLPGTQGYKWRRLRLGEMEAGPESVLFDSDFLSLPRQRCRGSRSSSLTRSPGSREVLVWPCAEQRAMGCGHFACSNAFPSSTQLAPARGVTPCSLDFRGVLQGLWGVGWDSAFLWSPL